MQDAGKYIIIFGIIMVVIGIVIYFGWGPKAFGWLGRLPGDIRIENENSRIYIPIATCVVLSILLTIIIRLISLVRGR
ncbi:DUF2905 domain-containing protein [bacterium]|nr:DUF2905 domain-containing protein [bacterium]